MSQVAETPRFKLYYWPIAFRGCFASYLFAYQDVPLLTVDDIDEIEAMCGQDVDEQAIPFKGPPVLYDLASGLYLSQVPAITLYVAQEIGLKPDNDVDVALCVKVAMDCNDMLMEICRYNGSMMWEREAWLQFRSKRFPRWLHLFEESLKRGHIGKEVVSFADVAVYALFGNMMRCLPELEADVIVHAPGIHALCQRIGAKPSLATYVEEEEDRYGRDYCGGQIEQSIRAMLALDGQSGVRAPDNKAK